MHKRIWFLAAAALALLAVVGSASAMTGGPKTASSYGKVMPFAQSWNATPKTPAGRMAKSTINVAQEQDLGAGCGWNINNAACTLAWAVWVGWNPILRGPYTVAYVNGGYKYEYDLVTNVTVNSKYIRYTIRKGAKWNWGGKLSPVTWQDFVYTVQLLNNPGNHVSSNVGVNQIASAKHSGDTVTFYWKTSASQEALGGGPKSKGCTGSNACGPFADYKDLLGSIYPMAATKDETFNKTMFKDCICGSNGKFVTDGPFYMSNYTRGQGTTLKKNPAGWYGKSPALVTVNFKIITQIDSEIEAIKGGEVDVADPQPTPAVAPLAKDKSINYVVAPGNYLEHIDLQMGNTGPNTPGAPLLKHSWFRQALMLGIDRQGDINASLPGVAKGLSPDNSLLYTSGTSGPFKKWNYSPSDAIAKMKANGCTGGPSTASNSNTKVWTCGGHKAEIQFMYASDNPRRVNSEAIVQANEMAIGIKVDPNGVPTSTLFGNSGAPAGNYNMTEFAWGGSVDPGGFISIWGTGGGENWLNYSNKSVDADFQDSLSQLNNAKRAADFAAADKTMANDVPAIPLYALPSVLTYKKLVTGVSEDPAAGFTWDMENWGWK